MLGCYDDDDDDDDDDYHHGPSCRIIPVALVTTAMSASNAPETLAAGAPIMGSVRMVTVVTGSAVATRVSMALRVRTVSQDGMESTAPLVSNTHTHTRMHALILSETLSLL